MKSKTYRLIAVVFMVTALFTLGIDVSILKADYCGDLQLEVDTPDGLIEMSFHLVKTGGPFLIVHAAHIPVPTPSDPDEKPILMSGTGQVVDGVFYMNIFVSQEHFKNCSVKMHWHDGRIGQASLDLKTKEGTFWMVGTDYEDCTDYFLDGFGKMGFTAVGKLPKCLRTLNK